MQSRGHSYTVNLDEIGVPLVILSPRTPAGTQVSTPVSLRNLPATVVDLVGLQAGSPFPGHSLAAYWGLPAVPGQVLAAITTPAFSEQADPSALSGVTPPGDLGHGRSRCPWSPRTITTRATAWAKNNSST